MNSFLESEPLYIIAPTDQFALAGIADGSLSLQRYVATPLTLRVNNGPHLVASPDLRCGTIQLYARDIVDVEPGHITVRYDDVLVELCKTVHYTTSKTVRCWEVNFQRTQEGGQAYCRFVDTMRRTAERAAQARGE